MKKRRLQHRAAQRQEWWADKIEFFELLSADLMFKSSPTSHGAIRLQLASALHRRWLQEVGVIMKVHPTWLNCARAHTGWPDGYTYRAFARERCAIYDLGRGCW